MRLSYATVAWVHPSDSYLVKTELWVAMEYMEGGSLTEVIDNNIMNESQIAAVASQVLEGLSFLHQRKIVHRDIKSDNVLLDIYGEIKLSTTAHRAPGKGYRLGLTPARAVSKFRSTD